MGEPARQKASAAGIAAHRGVAEEELEDMQTVTARLSLSGASLVRLLSVTGSHTEFMLASADGATTVPVGVAVSSVPNSELSIGNGTVLLDWHHSTLTHGPNTVSLSRTELRLLAALMELAPEPVSHEQLMARLWPGNTNPAVGSLAVWVYSLRKRFAAIGLPNAIRTARSIGYSLSL